MTKPTEKNIQETKADLSASVQFDMAEFEQRLAIVNQEQHEVLLHSNVYKEPIHEHVTLNFNIPESVKGTPKKIVQDIIKEDLQQSGLLASLELEAKQSLKQKDARENEKHDKNLLVHQALDRVFKFFKPYIDHVNTVAPAINRSYRLDASSKFTDLKWQGGKLDSRKQGMNETSLLSYVMFSANLMAPEPVLLKRPWSQFEAVVKELSHFKIATLDDLHSMHKNLKQEWLEARLDPALPINILFRANFEMGKVDVLTRNLEDFGQTAFRLEPNEISVTLLEELGLFLIARKDKLPALLQATPR